MVNIKDDRGSTGFGRGQAATLAIAGILGASWVGGTMAGQQRFDPKTGVTPLASTDLETVAAANGAAWDLPNLDHPRVDYWVDRFTTDKRGEFTEFLERMGRYEPMISAKLEAEGMPQDLIYLAMIESGFKPTAYSHANASGLWQFISETGQRYGLDINLAVDERNDPIKATDAALSYLGDLHDMFDSWYLAAAAYNSGEGRVSRIMREVTGNVKGSEGSYYEIYDRLPRETRDYVPLMIAAARIAKEPAKYGFDSVTMEDALAYEEIVVDAATPLSAITKAAGITSDELKLLNPHLKLDRTRNDMRSVVRVPQGARTTFLVNWPEVREQETLTVKEYRIRRGDSLIGIARHHGVSVDEIREANALRGSRIVAGRTLKIPSSG
jgi:membrane-bound lytic murein transglycosylase D